MSEDKLEEVVRDPAVEHAANVFHYLVVHASVKQYYYELKYVRDDRRLMDLIGKGLKELDTLKRSEDHKDKIAKLLIPSNEDLAKTLEHYRRFRERARAFAMKPLVHISFITGYWSFSKKRVCLLSLEQLCIFIMKHCR